MNELDNYRTILTQREKDRINEDVARQGLPAIFDKYIHYVDCTRWDKNHIYRLQQTIGYPYMHDMSMLIYLCETYDVSGAYTKTLIERHNANIEYEKEYPPVIYDKKHGLKKFKPYREKTDKSKADKSIKQKILDKVIKLDKLKFKLQ